MPTGANQYALEVRVLGLVRISNENLLVLDGVYGRLISMSVFVIPLIPSAAFELLIFLCNSRVGVACGDI